MQTSTQMDSRSHDGAQLLAPTVSATETLQWQLFVVFLVVLDAAAIIAAFSLAYLLRFKVGLPLLATPPHSLHFYSTLVFGAVPLWLVIFATYRLYDRHYLLGGIREYTAVVNACTIGIVMVILASFLDDTLFISRGWLLLSWSLTIAITGAARFVARRAVYRLRRRGRFMDSTIIIGANEEARALAVHLGAMSTTGLRIIGAVDDGVPVGTALADGIVVVGKLGDLDALVRRYGAKELLVAPTAVSREDLIDLYRTFACQQDIRLRMSSGLFEILTTGVSVKQVSGLTLISPEKTRITGIDAAMKMCLDYTVAFISLAISSPLLAIIALLIKLDSPGPVFHRRLVLGREGRLFRALKFRTMLVNADDLLQNDPVFRERFQQGFKLKDDPRVTRAGRVLRRTSLDELPQLANILLGQMSLVGPRMIVPEEADKFGKWQLNLLTVKPGITGPWQVNGRNEIPYDQRVNLSMHYIRNYTIWLDLQILLQTVPAVLGRRGAY